MVKGRLFPFQNHQSIKSIEDLENEFIDMSEKEEEYIDDNRFIISEHIKTAKKLIAINIKHIGKEKYDENANFDDLIFKMKLKRLLKQFEDIEIKYDELNIEQQNANNDKQKQKEEKEIEDNYFCIKGLSLIIDINKIIKQLNTCFIAYTSDKSIKYENEILENYMNRKYKEVLDEFEDIYSKIIFRKEEKQRKEKEKELNKTNTMMNIHQIDRNENYISILNNQCKICCCKNTLDLIELFKDNEITLENGNTYSMYDVFIDCMKQNNDEEEHSVLKRIFKMKLNGSRLIMITKQDIENLYFPIKFMNHENQSIFLQIIPTLNGFHELSIQSEEFECIEWKDEYYEPNYDNLSFDDISE